MRLFLGIELDESVKAAIYEAGGALAGAKRIPAAQLHITLKFLGHAEEDKLEVIKRAAGESAAANSCFEAVISGGGCFPPHGPVRIIWAGISRGAAELSRLAACCETCCEEIGFAREERPFSPHLTIARVKEDRSKGELRRQSSALKIGPLSQRIIHVVLYQSFQKSDGSHYEVLYRAPLK